MLYTANLRQLRLQDAQQRSQEACLTMSCRLLPTCSVMPCELTDLTQISALSLAACD